MHLRPTFATLTAGEAGIEDGWICALWKLFFFFFFKLRGLLHASLYKSLVLKKVTALPDWDRAFPLRSLQFNLEWHRELFIVANQESEKTYWHHTIGLHFPLVPYKFDRAFVRKYITLQFRCVFCVEAISRCLPVFWRGENLFHFDNIVATVTLF